MADFCESLLKRGFSNDVEDDSAKLKSLIIVKENVEVLEMPPEIFFHEQLADSLMTVIPSEPVIAEGEPRELNDSEAAAEDVRPAGQRPAETSTTAGKRAPARS